VAQQYFYTSNAVQTSLSASLGAVSAPSTGQTVQVASIAGWPTQFPAAMLLEWGTVNQERVTLTQAATGSGPYTFANCIRGDDGTAAPAHTAGAQVNHGVSARDFFQIAPVYNVCAYGADPTGVSTTSDAGIQAALNACSAAGGGTVYLAPGLYQISQTLQIHSDTTLRGAGMGATTIRSKNNWSPTQVDAITGACILASYGNTTASRITVADMTLDGNESNNLTIPSWAASSPECSPVGIGYTDDLFVQDIEVINSVGRAIYLTSCTHFSVTGCRVVTGQVYVGFNQQDGIHVLNCQYGVISGNNVDTGTITNAGQGVGDDGIAMRQYISSADLVSDVTVTGNVIRSATRGITMDLGGGGEHNITISGNDIYGTNNDGIRLDYIINPSTTVTNVAITGNTMSNIGAINGGAVSINGPETSATAGWHDWVISGNTVSSILNTSVGIYAMNGSMLVCTGNVLDGLSCVKGIQVGDIGTTSWPVTNFQVTGNTVNLSASAQTAVYGIAVYDSSTGCVTGNTLIGNSSAGSAGVRVASVDTACTGVAVDGNTMTGFATGITEDNAGAQPDYNTYTSNNTHGCTAGVNATGAHSTVSGNSGQIALVYNVCAYGADPTGTANSTAAIQAAINAAHTSAAAGGTVSFPPGTFEISSTLTLYPNVDLTGAGSGATVISQTSTSANGISAVDLQSNTLSGFTLNGPGSGTGIGFSSALSANPAQGNLNFTDVQAQSFGSHGFDIQNAIASRFECVQSTTNGGHGFYIRGTTSGASGTSCTFVSCYANTNNLIGFWIYNMTYCALDACAADTCGVGYQIDSCQGVALTACGAEGIVAKNGYDGTSFKVTGSFGVTLNTCWTYQNDAVAFWVTSGSTSVCLIAPYENSPLGGATASVKTDAGTMSTIIGVQNATATALTSNTYNELNDGTTGEWTVAGTGYLSTTNVYGNLNVATAGSGLQVAEGSNAKQGTAVLNGTTAVVVSNTSVTASSRIFLTINTPGGTPASPYVFARSAGTSFSIKSTGASDTSTVAYEIFEPG